MLASGASVARWMRGAGLAVALLVCAAAAWHFFSVDEAERAHAHGAEALNLAGRQRMLSQRLALQGLQLAAPAPGAAGPDAAALAGTLGELQAGRTRLQALPLWTGLQPPPPSPAALLAAVQALQQALPGGGAAAQQAAQALAAAADDYLAGMDSAVYRLQAAMEARIAAVRTRHAWGMAVLAALVSALGLGLGEAFARRFGRMQDEQRALHAELQRLALVAERTHNGVILADAQGRALWANAGFTRLSGYTLDELRGQRPGHLLQFEGTDPATVQCLREALAARQPVEVAIRNRSKHGRVYWQLLDIQPLLEPDGQLSGFIAVQTDITALVQGQERLAALLRALPVGMVQLDARGAITEVNDEACTILGMPREQLLGSQQLSGDWQAMDEDGRLLGPDPNRWQEVLHSGQPLRSVQLARPCADGLQVIRVNYEALRDAEGRISGVVACFSDITDALRQRRKLALTVDAAGLGTWDWHVPSGQVDLNPRWWQMLGWPSGVPSFTVQAWQEMVHPQDLPSVLEALNAHLRDGAQPYRCEFRLRRADGQWSWILAAGAVVERDAEGQPLRMAGIHMDISARRQAEERMQTMALSDTLTGLPNRQALLQRLAQCAAEVRRHPGEFFALLFLDFDRFKQINDTLGHAAGDALLCEIAQRLRSALRANDELVHLAEPQGTAARLGGDEFVVLLERLRAPDEAQVVAQRLLEVLGRPYQVAGQTLHSTVSIGIATSDRADLDPEAMLRDADTAMYEAKRRGRGRAVVFSGDMHARVAQALALETELRQALATPGELQLVYQPVVALADGAVVGVEALARWQHPQRGEVPPSEFIPVAEECGLIAELTGWVLQRACQDAAAWRHALGAAAPATVAVNLSCAHIRSGGVVDAVRAALQSSGLPPAALRLEVTESMAMDDELVAAELQCLRALGASVALDDFGMGYSSIAALDRLPLDAVKIDRSLVQRITASAYQQAMVAAVVQVARTLGLQVVAEGVETEAQAQALREAGCTLAQGWLHGRPMDARALLTHCRAAPGLWRGRPAVRA